MKLKTVKQRYSVQEVSLLGANLVHRLTRCLLIASLLMGVAARANEPLTSGATEMSATVPGTLTVNGVSVAVEATLEVTLVGDVLAVVGSLPVVLADHDVVAPSASIVISVADSGVVEFQLFLTRAVGGTG